MLSSTNWTQCSFKQVEKSFDVNRYEVKLQLGLLGTERPREIVRLIVAWSEILLPLFIVSPYLASHSPSYSPFLIYY